MPTYIVNTSLILLVPNDPHYSAASFCPTWAITSSNADPVDTYIEAGDCLGQFWNEVRGVVSEQAFYWLTNWRPIAGGFPFSGLDDSQALTPFGTAPGISPYFRSLMVRKMTGSPLRYWKGRAYIPFIGEQWATDVLCDPDQAEVADAALAFAGTYVQGNTSISPVKFSVAGGDWEPVLSATMSQFIAFQRRRNLSKRYYTYP